MPLFGQICTVFTSTVHAFTVQFRTVLSICNGGNQQSWVLEVYESYRDQVLYFLYPEHSKKLP